VGKVTSEKRFSHETYGEKFYIFDMEVSRLSDTTDIIPITVSERIIDDELLTIGNKLIVRGQFRSYNSYENEKSRLKLTVFAKDILTEDKLSEEELEEVKRTSNEVSLIGYICKPPIYRQTPFGREIADILLAVNRAYNKSDYIPSIAWGRNARFCQNLATGTEVKIVGRVQSRNYEKKYEDGTIENKVAYEVSISSLQVINEDDNTEKSENMEEAV
jgi:primosomal replication protein N